MIVRVTKNERSFSPRSYLRRHTVLCLEDEEFNTAGPVYGQLGWDDWRVSTSLWDYSCVAESSSHLFKGDEMGGRAVWGLASLSDNLYLISDRGIDTVLCWNSFHTAVAGNPWQQVTPGSGLTSQGTPHRCPFLTRDAARLKRGANLTSQESRRQVGQELPRGRKELQGHPAKQVTAAGPQSTLQLWISPLKLYLSKCTILHLNSIISKWYYKKIKSQLFL